MKKNQLFTLELLKEQITYDTETGLFIRNVDSNKAKVGDIANKMAGRAWNEVVHVLGCCVRADRLVWFYHHGKFPCGDLIHRDGDSRNCKIENLIDSGVAARVDECRKNHGLMSGRGGKYAAR